MLTTWSLPLRIVVAESSDVDWKEDNTEVNGHIP